MQNLRKKTHEHRQGKKREANQNADSSTIENKLSVTGVKVVRGMDSMGDG